MFNEKIKKGKLSFANTLSKKTLIFLCAVIFMAGMITSPALAQWNAIGTGTNSGIQALAYDSTTGNLYAGGSFTAAGGSSANKIAVWNGVSWNALGAGMNNDVGALAYDSATGNLYAGGWFTTADGNPVNHIAVWNGTTWNALGDGTDNIVLALAYDSITGNLYAGGGFNNAGGNPANKIAVWNGTTWNALGNGTDNTVLALEYDSPAGNLYVGGSFDNAGGNTANRIAVWDGAGWNAIGNGTNNFPHALVYDSADAYLYAGGNFSAAGGNPANFIAVWNGTLWSGLGIGMDSNVWALEHDSVTGNLYASGEFTNAGGNTANHIAVWNGTAWSTLGAGMDNNVQALAYDSTTGNLYAGGQFTTAGGVAANRIAKWVSSSPPPTPTVAGVTLTTVSGIYTIGSVITITVRFGHIVWVKGIPSLALNTGGPVPGHAWYTGGSGTKIITFQYTLVAGDDITKLDYWSPWALELNGGQIYSDQGVDVDLDLPVPGEEGSLGYDNTPNILSTVYSVYRFYSPGLSKHFFTTDENEKEYLLANAADVWQLENSPYSVFLPWQYDAATQEEKDTLMAVHRFYNAALLTHLYTADANEAAYLIAEAAESWQSEGPVFYVPVGNPEGAIPVYRFYSENLKVHLFTADEYEKNHLKDTAGDVWRYEGVAYYAYP